MSESQINPISLHERIEILDVLRGLAVCGILIGNMQWFSGYGMMPPALPQQVPLADRITHFLVHFFVEGKFYSIFSFLFGFGFALQIARAEERGDTKASLFKRRLFWLLIIGLASRLFAVGGRYPEHLCRDGLSAYSVSPENKRIAAQMGVRPDGDSYSDIHSVLYFVCRLCFARCLGEV